MEKQIKEYVLHFKDGTTEAVETRLGHQLQRAQAMLHRLSINHPEVPLDIIVNGKLLDYTISVEQNGQEVHYRYPVTSHANHVITVQPGDVIVSEPTVSSAVTP